MTGEPIGADPDLSPPAAPAGAWEAALEALAAAEADHAKQRAEAEAEQSRVHERHKREAAKRASVAAAELAKVNAAAATRARNATDELENARNHALDGQKDLQAKTSAKSAEVARILGRPGIDARLADAGSEGSGSRVRRGRSATERSLPPGGEAVAASAAATRAHLEALGAVIEAAEGVEQANADLRKAEETAADARKQEAAWRLVLIVIGLLGGLALVITLADAWDTVAQVVALLVVGGIAYAILRNRSR